MEFHPRLNPEDLEINFKRIILGSFPIWALVNSSDDSPEIKAEKQLEFQRKELFPFFYGSPRNKFWAWYKEFVDFGIDTTNVNDIVSSLNNKNIGITDAILSCERGRRSSLDKHLSKRTYNHSFFSYPKSGETLKVLCTSKGVMNEMFLNKTFYKEHFLVKFQTERSLKLQQDFIAGIEGSIISIKQPLFAEMSVLNGGIIQCLSMPSPGSPYRKLSEFGLNHNEKGRFLQLYLTAAFKWFIS